MALNRRERRASIALCERLKQSLLCAYFTAPADNLAASAAAALLNCCSPRISFGAFYSRMNISIPKGFRTDGMRFEVGNAMNPRRIIETESRFDIVAAINLLWRLPSLEKFLRQLSSLVKPGGQLILASPFSWLENFTPRREWLTPEASVKILQPHFRVARQRDLPFMIREHGRKYQLVVSNVMTFQRTRN